MNDPTGEASNPMDSNNKVCVTAENKKEGKTEPDKKAQVRSILQRGRYTISAVSSSENQNNFAGIAAPKSLDKMPQVPQMFPEIPSEIVKRRSSIIHETAEEHEETTESVSVSKEPYITDSLEPKSSKNDGGDNNGVGRHEDDKDNEDVNSSVEQELKSMVDVKSDELQSPGKQDANSLIEKLAAEDSPDSKSGEAKPSIKVGLGTLLEGNQSSSSRTIGTVASSISGVYKGPTKEELLSGRNDANKEPTKDDLLSSIAFDFDAKKNKGDESVVFSTSDDSASNNSAMYKSFDLTKYENQLKPLSDSESQSDQQSSALPSQSSESQRDQHSLALQPQNSESEALVPYVPQESFTGNDGISTFENKFKADQFPSFGPNGRSSGEGKYTPQESFTGHDGNQTFQNNFQSEQFPSFGPNGRSSANGQYMPQESFTGYDGNQTFENKFISGEFPSFGLGEQASAPKDKSSGDMLNNNGYKDLGFPGQRQGGNSHDKFYAPGPRNNEHNARDNNFPPPGRHGRRDSGYLLNPVTNPGSEDELTEDELDAILTAAGPMDGPSDLPPSGRGGRRDSGYLLNPVTSHEMDRSNFVWDRADPSPFDQDLPDHYNNAFSNNQTGTQNPDDFHGFGQPNSYDQQYDDMYGSSDGISTLDASTLNTPQPPQTTRVQYQVHESEFDEDEEARSYHTRGSMHSRWSYRSGWSYESRGGFMRCTRPVILVLLVSLFFIIVIVSVSLSLKRDTGGYTAPEAFPSDLYTPESSSLTTPSDSGPALSEGGSSVGVTRDNSLSSSTSLTGSSLTSSGVISLSNADGSIAQPPKSSTGSISSGVLSQVDDDEFFVDPAQSASLNSGIVSGGVFSPSSAGSSGAVGTPSNPARTPSRPTYNAPPVPTPPIRDFTRRPISPPTFKPTRQKFVSPPTSEPTTTPTMWPTTTIPSQTPVTGAPIAAGKTGVPTVVPTFRPTKACVDKPSRCLFWCKLNNIPWQTKCLGNMVDSCGGCCACKPFKGIL